MAIKISIDKGSEKRIAQLLKRDGQPIVYTGSVHGRVTDSLAAKLAAEFPGVPVVKSGAPDDEALAAVRAVPVGIIPKVYKIVKKPKKFSVGDMLYEASGNDDGTVDMQPWQVSAIKQDGLTKKARVYACLKASWTWGKRSKKHGDFGWLPGIPDWCRMSWSADEHPPGRLSTTKRAAWVKLRKEAEAMIADKTNFYGEDDKACARKWKATAERMIARL